MKGFDSSYFVRLNERLQRKDTINLAVGQPDFRPPERILRAWKDNIGKRTGYSPIEGLPELRELIQKKLKSENSVRAESVLVTAGAVNAIFEVMLAHLERGSEVILFSPHYGKYVTAPALRGASVKTVHLDGKGRPDMGELERTISPRTRMVVVNSPANPTGIVYSEDETKRIVELAEEHDLVILSDEAYEKYVYEDKRHLSPGKLSDSVITVNSFSKTYGLPDLRLGYLAGRLEMMKPVTDIHASSITSCPYASQMAAVEALKCGCPVDVKSFDRRRRLAIEYLDGAGAEYVHPEGAFYVYACTKGDSMALCNRLMDKGVLVMPSILFGGGSNAIRISYATDIVRLEKGLKLLTPLLKR